MPGEIALCDIDDACGTLYHALTDLAPIITLTWPPARQPSLGTEGGQPPAVEFQHQLQHMTDAERKWYLKQHEFTTSLQRCVRRPRYSPPGADHAHQESHTPRASRTACPRRPGCCVQGQCLRTHIPVRGQVSGYRIASQGTHEFNLLTPP